MSGIELESLGPMDGYVEDSEGNFLGKLPEQPLPVIYNTIPGGSYFAISSTQSFFLNFEGSYTGHLKVTNEGGTRIRVRTYSNNEIDGQAVFHIDTPVGSDLQIPFTSDQNLNTLTLQIDENNDGVIDLEVNPNSIITGPDAFYQ